MQAAEQGVRPAGLPVGMRTKPIRPKGKLMMPIRLAAFLAILATSSPAASVPIDIRDCPLDTLVFVDPSAGGSFAVQKVGTDYTWLCEDGFSPPDPLCSGPFGFLVLEGQHRSTPEAPPELKTAIYSVIRAAPCCDWGVEDGRSAVTGNEGFTWLAAGEAPFLRDMSFMSIESEHATDFGSPYYASMCVTP